MSTCATQLTTRETDLIISVESVDLNNVIFITHTVIAMRTDLLPLGEFFNISSPAFFDVKCLHIKHWVWIIIDNKWNAISSWPNYLSLFPNQNRSPAGTNEKEYPQSPSLYSRSEDKLLCRFYHSVKSSRQWCEFYFR